MQDKHTTPTSGLLDKVTGYTSHGIPYLPYAQFYMGCLKDCILPQIGEKGKPAVHYEAG